MRPHTLRRLLLLCAVTLLQAASVRAAIDLSSRELVIRRAQHVRDASTRELSLRLSTHVRDASSRELIFHRSQSQRSVASRQILLNYVTQVDVVNGFLMREYASIPTGPAHWMSLAVKPGATHEQLDLFVATTTRQNGTAMDPPDDYVHQVHRGDLRVTQFAAFSRSDSDPARIRFDATGDNLLVAARHYSNCGAVLRLDPAALSTVHFGNPAVVRAPLGLAYPPSNSGFVSGLYVGNDTPLSPSIFALDAAGTQLGYLSDLSPRLGALAFAPGNAFGDALYCGAEDGTVRKADKNGIVSNFSTALGSAVQGLAFSNGHGFGERLYALLADGRVLQLDANGSATPFLSGLLIEPLSTDVVRNDLQFTPAGDILYISDARRAKVYGVQMSVPTGTGGTEPHPVPNLARLENYPNPFNPTTTLRFELDASQLVELSVYDASGRRVQTLLRQMILEAGRHQLSWDGRDARGQRVASGVYFALLRTPTQLRTHKMLLLK